MVVKNPYLSWAINSLMTIRREVGKNMD